MASTDKVGAALTQAFSVMLPHLDERQRRVVTHGFYDFGPVAAGSHSLDQVDEPTP